MFNALNLIAMYFDVYIFPSSKYTSADKLDRSSCSEEIKS